MNENALYIATAIIAGLGTFFVGFLGKVPIVVAPGICIVFFLF
jgi:xanthine/uracil/vitamin C permease (AzgA family)